MDGRRSGRNDDDREISHTNIASGTLSGQIVQAGNVHGGVHIHEARAEFEPIVPRQLLPPPRNFIDRSAELAELTGFLDGDIGHAPTVVLVRGPGGVGKTALALRWLAGLVDRFPDGQLYADLALSTGEAVPPEDVLGQFLRALGVPARNVPIGLAERTALYRSVTASGTHAVLLDNAVSAGQARVLLPTSPTSIAVVTSRRALLGLLAEGARTLALAPLAPDSAVALLARAVGEGRISAERDHAITLAELCGGLPVALCVLAARIASRPRRPLARMVDELLDEQARLDALSAEGDLSVRSTFDIAYAELPAPLRRLYRTLGLLPGVMFPVEVAVAAVGDDLRVVRRSLDDLVDASLLDESGDDHYRLHDLVRVHALDRALSDDRDEDRAATLHRTLQWYLRAAQVAGGTVMPSRRVLPFDFEPAADGFVLPRNLDQHGAALDWLERERPSLVAAAHDAAKAEQAGLAYHLADALQPLFILHRHHRDAIEIGEMAVRAARAANDPVAENSMGKRLARWYAGLGHFDRAERYSTELLDRSRARGDRRAEASALKSLAILAAEQGRWDSAVAIFGDALAVLRPLGRRRGEALLLVELAIALEHQHRPEEAIGQLDLAMNLFRTLRPPDPYNEARTMAILGRAHLAAGHHDRARDLLQHAVAVLAEQGADHERGRAHQTMAALDRRTGDEAGARRHDEVAASLLARPDRITDDAVDG